MSFSINVNGHGSAADDVKEIFENTVRALRAVSTTEIGGSATGSDVDGVSFSFAAGDVADVGEPADAGEDDQADAADPGADDAASSDAGDGAGTES